MQAEPNKAAARRGRGGRPPAKDAGDVDRRILDAAASLFLQLGFDATTCEQVVAQAGAGKASLYARYANKEALFAAVVADRVAHVPPPPGDLPADDPLDARLQAAARSVLADALKPDVIALMRVMLATAHRMPELAKLADQAGRTTAVQRVAAAIAGGAANDRDALDRAAAVAEKFVDLVFVPVQMRALLGDDPSMLAHDAPARIDDAILLMTTGGWLTEWA